MPQQLPDNSNTAKKTAAPKPVKAEKVVDPVVTSEVKVRKTSLGKRFKDTFAPGDGRTVWAAVFTDTIMPGAKDIFESTAGEIVHRMLYGANAPRTAAQRLAAQSAVTMGRQVYANAFASPATMARAVPAGPAISHHARATHDFGQLIIPSRAEAEVILQGMYGLLGQYQEVTVKDLYRLANMDSNFTDESWGWRDLTGSQVQRLRGGSGWVLVLPPTIPLD